MKSSHFVAIGVFASVLTFICGYQYCASKALKVVIFDEAATVSEYITQISKKSLTPLQSSKLSKKFAGSVNDALKKYSIKNRSVILNKDMVRMGAIDITSDIQKMIAASMKGGK